MMITFLLFISLSFYPHSAVSVANLKYFETLTHVAVTSSIKRAADGSRHLAKHVMFRAFERDFDLTLKSGTHVKAKNFRARLVHKDGSYTMLALDESLIYSGHLTDKPHVRVNAHIEDTLWSFQIFDQGDIFAVEPAWRLLTPAENPRNDTLIAYRASDMTSNSFNSSQFCGVQDHKEELSKGNRTQRPDQAHVPHHHSHRSQDSSTDNSGKKKRLSDIGLTCILFLVGDYTFFKGRCKTNHKACLALMFANVQQADAIFRSSRFRDTQTGSFTDVGLEIGEIVLYSSYSEPTQGLPIHFNQNREWTVAGKLEAFAEFVSIVTYRKKVCTSHLFTDYPFAMRVLGLAWMMTVCLEATPGYPKKSSGLTSGTESTEGAIPSLQMNLVFVHGHNFGSEHDPQSKECSHPDNQGGNFIMWSRSVNGKSSNNLKFSPCSLRHIGTYLTQVSCLAPRSAVISFCGNGIVDGKEQCDAGAFGVIDSDPCCTSDCKFKNWAKCSDLNQACCRNCSMSPKGTLCLAKDFIECENASYCKGQCFRGICRSFCETLSIKKGLNLRGCLCQTDENGAACKWCCYDASDPGHPGPCVIHTNETVHDGRPCYLGYCEKGVCESYSASTVLRLYHYLPPFNPSKLGRFIRSNIVTSVILASLLVWVPAVILVCMKDKQELALNPPPAIIYEVERHRHTTPEYQARRQKKKKKREMRNAARKKSSSIFEMKANETPAKRGDTSKPFTWEQPEQKTSPEFPEVMTSRNSAQFN